jgi:pyruvate dehydrogenase E2 component (dihydrolipoamide acetyltransferase)
MPIKILMPALSPTMEEGNLAKWLKKEGETIETGELIAEIETDKATMEIEATDDGVLGKIVVGEGSEGVPVNAVIAVMLEEGEDSSALEGLELEAPAAKPLAAKPAPAAEAAVEAAPAAAAVAVPAPEPAPAESRKADGRSSASPLARRMAAQAGLDLGAIQGSGPRGRIVKADIEAALAGGPVPARATVAPTAVAPAPGAAYTDIPHTNIRKVIAKRLLEAKQTIPHFYLTVDCRIDRLLELRAELNTKSGDDFKLSINDFVIRAAALALRKVPGANAGWMEQAIRRYETVDVSLAVAIDDGLVTPIIRNADHKGLAQISNEAKELAERARAKPMALAPEEYQGGGFTISNLGMYGVREFAAIINPPQACVLAVGAGEPRPVVVDGALSVATVMTCTLSCDHRVVDGALGSAWLAAFKGLIEDPLTMLL